MAQEDDELPRGPSMVNPYHRMSRAEKVTRHREQMREPAIPCPFCETQTTVVDLPRHVKDGCPGQRAPHPLSEWVTWSEALALGVPRQTMSRWVRQGLVRARGERDRREYLRRDVTKLAVARMRSPTNGTVPPVGPKGEG